MRQFQSAALRRAMVLFNNPVHQAVRENINRRYGEMTQEGSKAHFPPAYISLSLQVPPTPPNLSDKMNSTSHYTASFSTFSDTMTPPVFSPSKWLKKAIVEVTAHAELSIPQKSILLNCLNLVEVNFDTIKAKRAKSPELAAGMVAFDIHTQLQTLSAVRAMMLDYCAEQGGLTLTLPSLPNLPR